MKHLIVICFTICPLLSFAQGVADRNRADSLLQVWEDRTQPDTIRAAALDDVIWEYYMNVNTDSAIYYSIELQKFSKKKRLPKWQAQGLNDEGVARSFTGEIHESLSALEACLEIRKKLHDKKGMASAFGNLSRGYGQLANYSMSLEFSFKALALFEEMDDLQGQANVTSDIGIYYSKMFDDNKAFLFFKRSMLLSDSAGNIVSKALALGNLGTLSRKMGKHDEAISYLTEGLELDRQSGYTYGEAVKLSNIASAYFDMGKITESRKVLDELRPLAEKMNYYQLLIQTDITYGYVHLRQGAFAEAMRCFSKARRMSAETHDLSMLSGAINGLYVANKQVGNFQDALSWYEEYERLQDTIYANEQIKAAQENEIRYKYQKMAALDSLENARQKGISEAVIAKQKAEANEANAALENKRMQQYALFGGLGLLLVFLGFVYNRFRVTKRQKYVIEQQKQEVEQAHELLEEKNKEILDSINYARRIQSAILPPQKLVKEYLPESFILYKPKDIVAGDFYWMESLPLTPSEGGGNEAIVLFAAADCTGHGVPGAMVSVVCNNGLNRSVREHGLTDPGQILDKTREIVIAEFEKSEEDVKDGMDISLVSLAWGNSTPSNSPLERGRAMPHAKLKWAGANNPLWIVRNGELTEYKPNKQPIGKYAEPKPFTTHSIQLQEGDTLYIFTDGYQDQFGGEKGKKFKASNFKELLLSIQHEPMERQREIIDEEFESWKGELEQIDDVCVIGVRMI